MIKVHLEEEIVVKRNKRFSSATGELTKAQAVEQIESAKQAEDAKAEVLKIVEKLRLKQPSVLNDLMELTHSNELKHGE